LEAQERGAWDAFVLGSGQGSFFHLSGWRNIFRKSFGFKTHFLVAKQGGQIRGLLPMVEQKSLLFGHGLLAAPFCAEGGPIGDETACEELSRAAQKLMSGRGARYLEFRSRKAERPGWQAKRQQYATFARALFPQDSDNLKAIPRKQRAVVRKAMEGALSASVDSHPDRLYPIYARSVHNLGTPVFAKSYFRQLFQEFPDRCDVVVISAGHEPVSAVLNFYFRDTVLPYYGGGLPSARKNGANDLMYWEVMRHAAARGCSRFDFGRSKAGSGAFAFKKNWGFDPDWLEYEYYLADGARLPDNNAASPRYKLMVDSWKKLPNPVADWLGPLLMPHLN
jgi:FemAB-related protein (PEP-CTERM system-associated)